MSSQPAHRSMPQPSAVPPFKRLWQVPTFFLGVLVVGLVWWHGPSLPPSPSQQVQRTLNEALEALESGDSESAKRLAREALDQIQAAPEHAGDVRFILGSAYLMDAEKGGPTTQTESYARARMYLQQAKQLSVSSTHEPRLAIRLILAEFHSGADVAALIPALEKAIELPSADRLNGLSLLISFYLQKKPADQEGAVRANERLLAQPNLTDPNPVRLQRGELLLKLDRKEEARAILARIPSDAPEYFAARHLRARSAFQNERWQEALALWQEAVRQDKEDSAQRREAGFYLGICHAHLNQVREALAAWEHLQSQAPQSHEAIAAAFHRAEAHLAAGADEAALTAFVAGLEHARPQHANRYLELAAMRRMVEEAWSRWFESGQHERARRLAEAYRPLATPGEADVRVAQASEAAGDEKRRQADRMAGPAAEEMLEQARTDFAKAGEAFEQVALLRLNQIDHAELLWAAAECFLKAKDHQRVLFLLEQCQTLNLPPQRRQEVMLSMAEAYQATRQPGQASKLLLQILAQPGAATARPRYLLALTHIDEGRYAEAERALRDLLAGSASEREVPEVRQGLFALGYVLYQGEQFSEAAAVFEAALERYPTHAQGLQAKYLLAYAYLQLAQGGAENQKSADTSAAREFYDKRRHANLEKALLAYQSVVSELSDRQVVRALARDQLALFRDAQFGVGECLCHLGRFPEAAAIYEKLAQRYPKHPDGLMGLLQLAQCQLRLGKATDATFALDRCRATLEKLDAKDLASPQPTRTQWEEWIDAVAKKCGSTK